MSKPVNSIKKNNGIKPEKVDNGGGFRPSVANSVRWVLDGRFLNWKKFNQWFPLTILITFLGLIYIGNNRFAERMIRETVQTKIRTENLLQTKNNFETQLTKVTNFLYVSKKLDSIGVKPSKIPIQKICPPTKKVQQ